MKLALLSDLHLSSKTPQGRVEDDFTQLSLNKLEQVFEIADKEGVSYILQAGDFFDNARPSYDLVCGVIDLLDWCRSSFEKTLPFVVIHGQHDLLYHSKKSSSVLDVLEGANSLFVAQEKGDTFSDGLFIHGFDYGDEIKPCDGDTGFSVLIAHTMVGTAPLYPGHELLGPEAFVKKYPGYDLYLLGDYHYPYTVKVGDAVVVNVGCMIRKTRAERDRNHKPKVVIFDTETRKTKNVYLEVDDPDKIFLPMDEKKQTKENKQMVAFIDKLKSSGQIGTSFRDNLDAYFHQFNTSQEVIKIIRETFPVGV